MNSDMRLMRAFSFNAEDLSANQQGFLTARQRRLVLRYIRIARWSSLLAGLAVLASVAIFLGIPLFASRGQVPGQAIPYLAGTSIVLVIIIGVFTGIGLRRLRPLQEQRVSTVDGRVHLTRKRFSRVRLTGYYAEISGVRFQLSSEAQSQSMVEGNTYRIHFIHYPPTQLILSVVEIT